MQRLLVFLALLVPLASWADADPRFLRLRDHAEPLPSLATFLGNYVGDCGSTSASFECSKKAKEFRQKATGKKYYVIINEEDATMLAPGTWDPSAGEYTVNITPFFASGGFALTHGAPKKQDGAGNPVLPLAQSKGTLPEDWNAARFNRLFSTRALRVQVVFTPQETWSLPKKGGGKLQGVKAKVDAVYVTVGRTGEQVALWTPDQR